MSSTDQGGAHAARWRRLYWAALAVGLAGWAALVVGAGANLRQASFSYLAAYAYALSVALGGLVLLAIGHVMGSTWFVAVRRLAESVAGTLPILAVLFVPVLLARGELYPWAVAQDGHAAADTHLAELLRHKRPYLNTPFFVARAAFYFAAWIGVAAALRRWSLRQDLAPAAARPGFPRAVSAAALPAVALTLTFAAIDWIMSLTPAWHSSVFGLYFYAGGFAAAVAVVILLAVALARAGALPQVAGGGHYYALGRLLLAFVVVWAYLAFAQGFLIWIANKPDEVTWYLARARGSWGAVGIALGIGHFALPFFILLSRRLKWRPMPLAALATWLLALHAVDVHWLVLPVLHPHGFQPHWLDVAALAAVVGTTVAFGAYRAAGHPLVPVSDPRLAAAIAYQGTMGRPQ